uniref:C-type lectin domain-containing protein n=1 Tax=Anabas testudineus TaxID=64144 RepID=A0A3Q1IL53_ANATE
MYLVINHTGARSVELTSVKIYLSKCIKIILIISTALCFLSSSFPRLYVLVPMSETWNNAQSYCRSKYNDLAAVQNQEELAQLNQLIGTFYYVWTGLHTDTEAGFRMWAAGEPSFGLRQYKACVAMLATGKWSDVLCSSTSSFICYNGKTCRINMRIQQLQDKVKSA